MTRGSVIAEGRRVPGAKISDWLKVILPLLLIGGLLLLCVGTPEVREGDVAGVAMSLPDRIAEWTGEDIPMSDGERHLLPPGTQLARKKYANPDGYWLVCTIVLSSADRRSIHKPEICLPGQGWTTDSGEVRQIDIGGKQLPVMSLDISRGMAHQDGTLGKLRGKFAYWFVGRDVLTPHHWERLFRTAYDRIFRGVGHRWAYVSVMAVETAAMRQGDASGRSLPATVDGFIAKMAPVVLRPGLLDVAARQ